MRFSWLGVATITLLSLSLQGCLMSDKPLLPGAGYQARQPLQDGYYIYREDHAVVTGEGRLVMRENRTGRTAMLVRKVEGGYVAESQDKLRKSARRFQLFSKQASDKDFILQDVSANGETLYFRARLANDGSLFALDDSDERCETLEDGFTKRWLGRGLKAAEKGVKCNFTSAEALVAALESPQTMHLPKSSRSVLTPVPANGLIAARSQEGPQRSNHCDGLMPDQSVADGFGRAGNVSAGLQVVAAARHRSGHPNTTSNGYLALEKGTGWAWAGRSDPVTPYEVRCGSDTHLMRLIKPTDENRITTKMASMRDYCGEGACMTAESAISNAKATGAAVLAQGIEYAEFPDGVLGVTGRQITVLGKPGASDPFFILLHNHFGGTVQVGR